MTRHSPETIDGLEFEMRLARNPHVKARREDYWRRRKACAEQNKHKSSAELIAELKANNPAYIVELLEKSSHVELLERYAGTFTPRLENTASPKSGDGK